MVPAKTGSFSTNLALFFMGGRASEPVKVLADTRYESQKLKVAGILGQLHQPVRA